MRNLDGPDMIGDAFWAAEGEGAGLLEPDDGSTQRRKAGKKKRG